MKMFKRNKITKALKKLEAEKVEIRYPLTLNDVATNQPPSYEIRAVSANGFRRLGYVGILESTNKSGDKIYIVRRFFDEPGQHAVIIGERNDLLEASSLAYKTSMKLAQEIANKNKLPLEDLVVEDEKKLEDEQLGADIDRLRYRHISVFILFILGGIVLGSTSLTATGNVLGNLTGTSQGLLGIFLFVLGITGIYFRLRKR